MNQDKKWWADNIRSTLGDDLGELVDSMRAHGWVAEFPALADEHGVVLVGHRRMKAAEVAGVEPIVKTISFGDGDAADAERVRLAIVSNIGAKPLTAEDRKRIAEHLYGERKWTQNRIAEALGVTQRTISNDVAGLEITSKPPRPRGGRPKGAPRTTKAGVSETTKAIREQVRPMIEAGTPLNVQAIADDVGHSRIVTEAAIAAERGRLEGLKEAEALRPVDVATLGATAKERMAALEKRLEAKIYADYWRDVRLEADRALARRDEEERLAIARANEILEREKGRWRKPFTAHEFKHILLWAVSPNGDNDPSKRVEAFILLKKKQPLLCEDGPIRTRSSHATPLPKTREELLARRKGARRI